MSSHGEMIPRNEKAEKGLLGCMIFDPECVADCIIGLRTEDFFATKHRTIFEALLALYEKASPIDLLTLETHLREAGRLDDAGGVAYMLSIAEEFTHSGHFREYIKLLQGKSMIRSMVIAGKQIVEEGCNGVTDFSDFRNRSLEAFWKSSERDGETGFVSAGSAMDQAIRNAKENKNRLYTGFQELDRVTGGWKEGDYLVLGAATSMGKTAMGLAVAVEIAKRGYPVHIFSVEMTQDALSMRFLSMRTGIPHSRMQKWEVYDSEIDLVKKVQEEFSTLPITYSSMKHPSPTMIRAEAKKWSTRNKFGLMLVDYLQLLRSSTKFVKSPYEKVSAASQELKAIALENKVAILCLAQLNRQYAHRESKRPSMTDLRDSGTIEQDADQVLLLHRDGYFEENPGSQSGPAELIVAKNRDGAKGIARFYYDAATVCFRDPSWAVTKEDWHE